MATDFIGELTYPIADIIPDIQIRRLMKDHQISYLNKIQGECIHRGLFFHQNFLVCTPSGSGKTLIGELAIANCLMKNLGTAVYLVPYKALANEKTTSFGKTFQKFGINVKGLTGDSEIDEQDLSGIHLLITTFEKCDALLRNNHPFLQSLRTIVVDEIHELGASHRGARLEILITRLLSQLTFPQIIALSATINNYQEFAGWLSSLNGNHRVFNLIQNDKRPIKLNYQLQVSANKLLSIKEYIQSTLPANGQVLIFVNRRKDCLRYTKLLRNFISQFLSVEELEECETAKKKLQMHRTLAKGLIDVIDSGCAFHNASLGAYERNIVESLYKKGIIKVLVATTTLAAGVNTPARVAIVEDIVQYRKSWNLKKQDYESHENLLSLNATGIIRPHSPNILFQMLGRAGRRGFDDKGEGVVLLRNEAEKKFARRYYFQEELNSENELVPKYADLLSQLNDRETLKEMVLLLIASQSDGVTPVDISQFLQKTFFGYQTQDFYQDLSPSELLQQFFIEEMDLGFFVKKYGDPNYKSISEPIGYSIIESAVDMLKVQLSYQNQVLNIEISLKSGLLCSCSPYHHFKFQSNDQNCLANSQTNHSHSPSICIHITFLFNYLITHQKHLELQILCNILPLLANHEYILDYLVENRLLSYSSHSNRYKITSFGKLGIGLYIYPKELVWIRTLIEKFDVSSKTFLLEKIIEFWTMNHVGSHQKVIMDIISDWIGEYTVNEILKSNPKYGVGDIFQITRDMTRICTIFEAVGHFLREEDLVLKLQRLNFRIKHGIKEELVDLMERLSTGISRNRARLLYNAGYISANAVRNAEPVELAHATGMKLSIIMQILGISEPISRQSKILSYLQPKKKKESLSDN